MSPTLSDGDYVIVTKPRTLRSGFIYVINHTDLGQIIKRLDRVENDRCFFTGDNKRSVSEAIIAPVTQGRVIGHARWAVTQGGIISLKNTAPSP